MEVVEVCRVAPDPLPVASPEPPKSSSLPLTFFDLRWLRVPPPHWLIFYQIPAPNTSGITTSSFFFDSILPKLKHSLSLTLHHFLPLAGNLTWPQHSPEPVIVYAEQDDAVSLSVAQSTADSHHLSALISNHDHHDATALLPLVANLAVTDERASVIAIQVTLFPNCGYFSIGTTMHHAVLDGKTLSLFMKSWAHTCRSLIGSGNQTMTKSHVIISLPEELKPFYARARLMDDSAMASLGAIYSNQWLDFDGPNNRSLKLKPDNHSHDRVRRTFQLPRAKIEKLRRLMLVKDDVELHVDHDKPPHVSTFSLTCAYVLVCLVKAEVEEVVNVTNILLIFAVDCRSRLEPPLPMTYFGNCVSPEFIALDKQVMLGKEGFVEAVHAISKAIKGLKKGVLNGAENWVSILIGGLRHSTSSSSPRRSSSSSTPEIPRVYAIVGSPRFEFYSIDFGWGQPKKVEVISGGISLSESRNGDGGLEIGLVLKKHQMEAFASFFTQGLESL
ncbi:Transferase [Trema orientale]|uniref:Transferase n=1 Tax=Trema orientale TaxID=63057 RepID=A0A2P5BW10_TREOI|nr:Transferase [Trema orientale]